MLVASAGTVHAGDVVIEHSVARQWNEALLEAIRKDTPRPPVHARNLFHTSVVMYDAWCAYQTTSDPYLVHEQGDLDGDIEAQRHEAISYAAYRLLKHRFATSVGAATTLPMLDDLMLDLGYDPKNTITEGNSPAAIGNRIAQAVIAHGFEDGSNEAIVYADPTYSPLNPEMPHNLPGTNGCIDANRWQPLAFEYLVLQNGIVIGASVQSFVGPHWGHVEPFALRPRHQSAPGVYYDPGPQPMLGGPGDDQFKQDAVELIWMSASLDPTDSPLMDIGPAGNHNNSLGANDGTGYGFNPITGEPYEPVLCIAADYYRCLAEYWADGPSSETPPGHWNKILNENVSDNPLFEKRLWGTGEIIGDLEWDVKVYLALNGAVHDAAVAAWGIKGHYDSARPITHIRYMCERGQSSDPKGPSYHPDGIPLVPGLIEVITEETAAPGGRHHHLIDSVIVDQFGKPIMTPDGQFMYYGEVGDIAVRSWLGEPEDPDTQLGGVGWILGKDWKTYQLTTFVTPPFAGYISGHSTFSRSSAEVLSLITGSEYFPGGLATHTLPEGWLEFEYGPTEDITLSWAKYYDAADEAGISRLWGSIHPSADDLPARIIGSKAGIAAAGLAKRYFNGQISCPADITNTGSVGMEDLVIVLANFGMQASYFEGDVNDDGVVDLRDLNAVLARYGQSCR
ncbi:MAG: DUF6851 domain-containing protein [Phycisphaerales bacterium]